MRVRWRVTCLSKLPWGEPTFNTFPCKTWQTFAWDKDNFPTRKRGLTCVEERDLYHALPKWMPAFSQTGKRKTKTHVILIKSFSTDYALFIFKFLIEMELSKCLAKEQTKRKERSVGEEEGLGALLPFCQNKVTIPNNSCACLMLDLIWKWEILVPKATRLNSRPRDQ